jgi:predicted transcriptional regulator
VAEIDDLKAKLASVSKHRDDLVSENTKLNREFKRIVSAEKDAADAKTRATAAEAQAAALTGELAAAKADLKSAQQDAAAKAGKAAAYDQIKSALAA